jgi:hypothetical protein
MSLESLPSSDALAEPEALGWSLKGA